MTVPLDLVRARELWSVGRRRPALDGLVAHVRANPSDSAARLALVEFYRELGAPDQAGRWAAALEGVADERELDRLARLLAASGVYVASAPTFLALPRGPMTQQLEDLLAGPVERYRRRLHEYAVRPGQRLSPVERLSEAVVYAWGTTVAVLVLAAAVVWTVAGVGVSDIRLVSRIAAVVVGTLLGISALLSSAVQLIEGERRSSIGWLVVSLLLLAVVAAAVARGLVLPWDD